MLTLFISEAANPIAAIGDMGVCLHVTVHHVVAEAVSWRALMGCVQFQVWIRLCSGSDFALHALHAFQEEADTGAIETKVSGPEYQAAAVRWYGTYLSEAVPWYASQEVADTDAMDVEDSSPEYQAAAIRADALLAFTWACVFDPAERSVDTRSDEFIV